MRPVVITAALTGVLATRDQCPAIPYTPSEIAEEGRRAHQAGAAILHIHARNDDGSATFEAGVYQEIRDRTRELCPDAILNFSTGGIGITREQRAASVAQVKPEVAALNMGSMNYALYSPKKKKFYHDHVFANPFKDIRYFVETMNQAGTLPEMEVFDTGHIHNAYPLRDLGLLGKIELYSLVMGVLGGIPATAQNLAHQVRQLPPGARWQTIGIGHGQWNLLGASIALGGNIRVGLEDNFYLPDQSMSQSNGDLVEAAVKLVEQMGHRPATVAETREMYGLERVS